MEEHWAIEEYMDYLEVERGFAQNSLASYRGDLEGFFRFLSQEQDVPLFDVDIREVNNKVIRRFLRHCKQRGNTNRTLNRKLVVLRSFFGFHSDEDEGIIEHDPTRKIRSLKTEKRLPVYLTKEQCLDLLSFVRQDGIWPARDYAILMIFLQCGLRTAELVGLRTTDLLFSEELIRVFGKGNKERVVPLLSKTAQAVQVYLKERKPITPTDRLFLTTKGRPLTKGGLGQWFRIILERWPNSRPGLSLHKLRHTCLTMLLDEGVDLRTIQEIAGHISIATTQIYTHVSKAELKSKMRLHPLA